MSHNITITGRQALKDTITRIKKFKKEFGIEATKEAIIAGAFHKHPDYGDVSAIIYYKEYNEEQVSVPVWIYEIFAEILSE
jgi:hypothetical protein